MAKLTPSQMETIDYGQQGWTAVINHNLTVINDWFARLIALEQSGKQISPVIPLNIDYTDPKIDGALLIYNKDSGKWEAFTEGRTAEFMWFDYQKYICRSGLLMGVPENIPGDEHDAWTPWLETPEKTSAMLQTLATALDPAVNAELADDDSEPPSI